MRMCEETFHGSVETTSPFSSLYLPQDQCTKELVLHRLGRTRTRQTRLITRYIFISHTDSGENIDAHNFFWGVTFGTSQFLLLCNLSSTFFLPPLHSLQEIDRFEEGHESLGAEAPQVVLWILSETASEPQRSFFRLSRPYKNDRFWGSFEIFDGCRLCLEAPRMFQVRLWWFAWCFP